jgi:hypothetical protein
MTDIVPETPSPTGQPLRSVPRDSCELPPASGALGTRGTRERLPQRRAHELLEFEHAGIAYVAGVGRFADGRLAEIFLNAGKVGAAIETHARDAAITVSLLLQHGCPPETIRHALTRNRDGTAAGPLGMLLDRLATNSEAEISVRPSSPTKTPEGHPGDA